MTGTFARSRRGVFLGIGIAVIAAGGAYWALVYNSVEGQITRSCNARSFLRDGGELYGAFTKQTETSNDAPATQGLVNRADHAELLVSEIDNAKGSAARDILNIDADTILKQEFSRPSETVKSNSLSAEVIEATLKLDRLNGLKRTIYYSSSTIIRRSDLGGNSVAEITTLRDLKSKGLKGDPFLDVSVSLSCFSIVQDDGTPLSTVLADYWTVDALNCDEDTCTPLSDALANVRAGGSQGD